MLLDLWKPQEPAIHNVFYRWELVKIFTEVFIRHTHLFQQSEDVTSVLSRAFRHDLALTLIFGHSSFGVEFKVKRGLAPSFSWGFGLLSKLFLPFQSIEVKVLQHIESIHQLRKLCIIIHLDRLHNLLNILLLYVLHLSKNRRVRLSLVLLVLKIIVGGKVLG